MSVNPNWPGVSLGIELVPGSGTFIDLAGRVRSITANRGRQYELAAPQAGTMTIAVDNIDGALDPTNTASPYYPNVKINRKVQLTFTYGGTTKTLWTGYVERYPQRWESAGVWQWTDMVCVDVLGLLAHAQLEPYFHERVRNLPTLSAWYPLDDVKGTTRFGERSSAGLPPALVVTSGTPNLTAGNTLTPVGVKGVTGVTTTEQVGPYVSGNNVSVVSFPKAANPSPTGPWTVIFGFQMGPKPAAGYSGTIFYLGSASGDSTVTSSSYVLLSISPTGTLALAITGTATLTTGIDLTDGPHLITIEMASDLRTVYLSIDGGGAYSLVAPAGTSWVFDDMMLGGFYTSLNPYNSSSAGPGTYDDLLVFSTGVYTSGLKGATIWPAWSSAGRGDGPGTRLGALASALSLPTGAVLASSGYTSTLGPADWNAKSGTQLLVDLATAEGGTLYVNGAGQIVLISRHYRENASAQYNVGEGNVYTYNHLTLDFDSTHVVNDVTINQPGGVTAHVTNSTSIGVYGRRTLSMSLDVVDPGQITDAANYYATFYGEPQQRVSGLTFDLASKTILQGMLTSQGEVLNSCIQVNRAPGGTAPSKALLAWVEQISFTVSSGVLTLSMVLSPADFNHYFQLDDATYGTINTTNRLSY